MCECVGRMQSWAVVKPESCLGQDLYPQNAAACQWHSGTSFAGHGERVCMWEGALKEGVAVPSGLAQDS